MHGRKKANGKRNRFRGFSTGSILLLRFSTWEICENNQPFCAFLRLNIKKMRKDANSPKDASFL
jgi:hypothetical protein